MNLSLAEAEFLPVGISDYNPILIKVMAPPTKIRPFKFFDCWADHPDFLNIVSFGINILGIPRMFCLYQNFSCLIS